MTAYRARTNGRTPKGGNIKDRWATNSCVQPVSFFGVPGFMPTRQPGVWTYAWQDVTGCPKLIVTDLDNGQFTFAYEDIVNEDFSGTHIQAKGRLDDLILEMYRYEALLADEEIDIDQYMADLQLLADIEAGIDEEYQEAW